MHGSLRLLGVVHQTADRDEAPGPPGSVSSNFMFEWWKVVPDSDRQQWQADPFAGVGPLHFGMTPDEVAATLDEVDGGSQQFQRSRPPTQDHYSRTRGQYRNLGLTLYYGLEERLNSVVIDALSGPQVFAEGVALTGRVPSELERWIVDRAEAYEPDDDELWHFGTGHGSASLGLILGVQRAGDHLLTQPIFVNREVWDGPSEGLPAEVSTLC